MEVQSSFDDENSFFLWYYSNYKAGVVKEIPARVIATAEPRELLIG